MSSSSSSTDTLSPSRHPSVEEGRAPSSSMSYGQSGMGATMSMMSSNGVEYGLGVDLHGGKDIKTDFPERPTETRGYSSGLPDLGGSEPTLGGDYDPRMTSKDSSSRGRYSLTVTDPEKKGDGINQYVSYKVTTKTEISAGQYSTSSVVRRYKDFVWLHDQLVRKYKGYLIPALPDKALIGRFTSEFINERRRALESFLNRIAVHSELRDSKDVELFLSADEGFLEAKQDRPDPGERQDGAFASWFKHTFSSGRGERPLKTEDDRKCDKVVEYAERLDNHLTAVHTQVDALLKRSKGLAKCWFDFGLQCTLLGQYETKQDEAVLGAVFSKLGNVADLLSVMMTKKIEMENVHFREPIKDYLRMVGAVKDMIKTRTGVHTSYIQAVAELEAKQNKLAGVQGAPDKAERALQLEKQVEEAQALVDQRLKELKRVTALCLAEAGRFRLEKEQALKNVVVDFVRMQIDHSKKIQKAWESILPDLQSV